METMMSILNLFGVVSFAYSGFAKVYQETKRIVLAAFCALLCTFGGGLIRDAFVLWTIPAVFSNAEVFLALAVSAVCIVHVKNGFYKNQHLQQIIYILDALGLACFVIVGADKAITFNLPAFWVMICGFLTGCGGGCLSIGVQALYSKTPKKTILSIFSGYRLVTAISASLYLFLRNSRVLDARIFIVIQTLIGCLSLKISGSIILLKINRTIGNQMIEYAPPHYGFILKYLQEFIIKSFKFIQSQFKQKRMALNRTETRPQHYQLLFKHFYNK